MLIRIFVILVCTMLYGCDKESKLQKGVDIKIQDLRFTSNNLTFDYHIINNLPHDIWACDDIDVYSEQKIENKLKDDILWIRLRSIVVPDHILFEMGIVARYVRVKSGAHLKGTISLDLPIDLSSPIFDYNKKTIKQVKKAIFELGYYEDDLSKAVSDFIEIKGQDEIYVFHLWEGIKKEKSVIVGIENV